MAEIQPTWPKKLDMTHMPATVSWQSSDVRLDDVLFNFHWTCHDGANSAFFKMTGKTTHRGTSIFIFIPPEPVCRLSVNVLPEERPFGPDTLAFSFDMLEPPAIVLPKVFTATDPTAEEIIKSLYTLASQTTYTVYAKSLRRVCPKSTIDQICTAIPARSLSSIESLSFPSVKTLYQGQGGQVVEGKSLRVSEPNPPAYSDSPMQPIASLRE